MAFRARKVFGTFEKRAPDVHSDAHTLSNRQPKLGMRLIDFVSVSVKLTDRQTDCRLQTGGKMQTETKININNKKNES